MPSAAQPFTPRVVASLRAKKIEIAGIVLHTGVSSLEVEVETVEDHPLYAEPYSVPLATASAINRARQDGRRVIAVGTTVIRALESAWDGAQVRPASGFTQVYVHPGRGVHTVDGLDHRPARPGNQPSRHAVCAGQPGPDSLGICGSRPGRLSVARIRG